MGGNKDDLNRRRIRAEARRAAKTIRAYEQADEALYQVELSTAKDRISSMDDLIRFEKKSLRGLRGDERNRRLDSISFLRSVRKELRQELRAKKNERDYRGSRVEWSSEIILLDDGSTLHTAPIPGSAPEVHQERGQDEEGNLTTHVTVRNASMAYARGNAIAGVLEYSQGVVAYSSFIHSHPEKTVFGSKQRPSEPSVTDLAPMGMPEKYSQGEHFVLGPNDTIVGFAPGLTTDSDGGDWVANGEESLTPSADQLKAARATLSILNREQIIRDFQSRMYR